MAKKGDRKITNEVVMKILEEQLVATANKVGELAGTTQPTARKKLDDMVDAGIINMRQETSGKNTMRYYRLRYDGKEPQEKTG